MTKHNERNTNSSNGNNLRGSRQAGQRSPAPGDSTSPPPELNIDLATLIASVDGNPLDLPRPKMTRTRLLNLLEEAISIIDGDDDLLFDSPQDESGSSSDEGSSSDNNKRNKRC